MDDTIAATPLSRRRFLATSALVASAGAAGALLATGEPPHAEADRTRATTTLAVMYQSNEMSLQQVKAFERQHPGVTVRFIEYSPVRLSSMLAAGQPPDFVRTYGAPEMPSLIARGLCADLTSYFNKSRVLPPAQLLPINDVYRFDKVQGRGPRYGMAKDWSPDAMIWYDKDVFDQARVPYPSATTPLTYDELLALAKKLVVRKNGKTLINGLDASYGFLTQGKLNQLIAQQGGSLYNGDFTAIDLTSSAARRALKWYVDYAQSMVGPSPLDPSGAGIFTDFPAKRTAMGILGYWFGGFFNLPGSNGQPVARMGLLPTPQMGHTRISACITGAGAWIAQNSPNKDLAWTFMEYFMGGQPAIDRAKSGFGLPALSRLLPDVPEGTPYQKAAAQVVKRELPYFRVLHFSPYISDNAFEAIYGQVMTPVLQGKVSFDAGVRQLQDTINTSLRQGKAQVG